MIEAFRSLSRLFASDAFHQKLIHNPRKRINQKSATREREVKKNEKQEREEREEIHTKRKRMRRIKQSIK